MMPPEKLRKADLVTAGVLIVLGLSVVVKALRMPYGGTYGGVNNAWYVSPAMFPLFVGTLLILCSIGVAVHAIREGGHRGFLAFWKERVRGLPRNAAVGRMALVCAWTAVLVFGAMGRINFYVAGFLYLFVFMLLFHRPAEGKPYWRSVCVGLVVSLFASSVTIFLFERYLLVPFP